MSGILPCVFFFFWAIPGRDVHNVALTGWAAGGNVASMACD